MTVRPGELSLVCRTGLEPPGARVERGWRALWVTGPLDFSLVGIVAGVTVPLAEAGVGVFVLSTFDTDAVLIRGDAVPVAVGALEAAGHTVLGPATPAGR